MCTMNESSFPSFTVCDQVSCVVMFVHIKGTEALTEGRQLMIWNTLFTLPHMSTLICRQLLQTELLGTGLSTFLSLRWRLKCFILWPIGWHWLVNMTESVYMQHHRQPPGDLCRWGCSRWLVCSLNKSFRLKKETASILYSCQKLPHRSYDWCVKLWCCFSAAVANY